jgi:para-nitrobenzyl esterase
MAMPAAEGLFHKAIVQSGPGLTGVSRASANKTTNAVIAELGVDPSNQAKVHERLLNAPADTILAAVQAAQAEAGGGFGGLQLAPVVDGNVLPRDPFVPAAPEQSADVPLLIGWNKDEMTIFNTTAPWFGTLSEADLPARVAEATGGSADALLEVYRNLYPDYSPTYIYNAVLGDNWAFRGSVTLAEHKAAQPGAPVYMYYLTWETPVGNGVFKSPHTLDIPFMFNNVDKAVALTGDSPEARKLEEQMSSSWIAFARRGDPNNDTVPEWPAYDHERRAAMVFDVKPTVVDDPKREVRLLLQGE